MTDAGQALAQHIARRLQAVAATARAQWDTSGPIRHCVVDALLLEADARTLGLRFPAAEQMRLRDTFRERKFVSAQMNRHDATLEAALFAFHAPAVVEAVRGITGKLDLVPDPELYAGGISMMGRRHFLNPHIDNSHDAQRSRWRNLNLLYYVTPEWPDDGGGDLELWGQGMARASTTIAARFNRLVIMETHQHAWHSVRPVAVDRARCCISNYYFGDTPMRADQRFHVTSFRARPGQPFRDLLSRLDSSARMLLRKGFRSGVVTSRHRYER